MAIRDQRKEALVYLEDKKVLKLFDALGVRLAQEKPESPNDFLISELRAMQALKSEGKPVRPPFRRSFQPSLLDDDAQLFVVVVHLAPATIPITASFFFPSPLHTQIKLFSDSDIENMFDIFDITGRGYLDDAQVAKALQAVGIKEPRAPIPFGDKINRRTFHEYM